MGQDKHRTENLLAHLGRSERHVVEMVAKRKPLAQIAKKVGLPERQVRQLLHSARLAFGANDDLVDDYLSLIGDWEAETGSYLIAGSDDELPNDLASDPEEAAVSKGAVLEQIEAQMSPQEMRDLAASLLRLADAFDQNWTPENVRAEFHWPSGAARIERNALELAKRAVRLLRQREMREKFLPKHVFGEPAWNMLLELFIQFAGGAKVSGKSLCITAACPQTTALRYIARLEEDGLIKRETSPNDRRVTLFSLTRAGVIGVGRVLERLAV